MKVNLRYPLYLIVSGENVVIAEADGHECFLIYSTRELAELYIEQVREHGQVVQAQQVSEQNILGLIESNPGVPYFALDNVATPQTFKLLKASDVADSAR